MVLSVLENRLRGISLSDCFQGFMAQVKFDMVVDLTVAAMFFPILIYLLNVLLIYSVVLNFFVPQSLYTYIHSFSFWFIPGYSVECPVLYNRTLFIHSVCHSLRLPIPDS